MEKTVKGRIIKGVGGLYSVLLDSGRLVKCRARGAFRHGGITLLAGDRVIVGFEGNIDAETEENVSFVIEEIEERKNALIRPPLANLDYLFVTIAAASPTPVLYTADKLFSICIHNKIEPVALITKCELDRECAENLENIYRKAGFDVILTSAKEGEGISALRDYINSLPDGSLSAFSGASGVGKSTLMNCLFPSLELMTSDISRKNDRGRHTTRQTELFSLSEERPNTFIADTPGFTMLDFEQFDFFTVEELPYTMRDFDRYIGYCKYKKCTHTKEEGCAVIEAVRDGDISPSRHESYVSLYNILKAKKKW